MNARTANDSLGPEKLARGLAAALASILLGLLAYAFIRRIPYPFGLEWMEGAMVDHVARIANGQRVYVPPTLEFVPFIYPPLYYVVSASVAKVTGVGFLPLRLVSALAALASLGLVYAFVSRETKQRFAALCAAGLMAGTYPLSGFWLDLGRVDSLLLCLLLCAAYVVRFGTGWKATLGAALLVTAAFFTKQVGLTMVLPFAFYLSWVDRRRAVGFVVAVAILVLGTSVVVDSLHQGWFGYYTHRVVGGHEMVWREGPGFVRGEVLMACGLALALSLVFWVWGHPRANPRARLFYGTTLAGVVAVALAGRMHTGGWINALIPAHAGIAVVFGLGLGSCLAESPKRDRRLRVFGLALASLQLATLLYDPSPAVPTEADRLAGRAWLEEVRAVPGPVWTPHHGHLPTLAGKASHAHLMAVLDVMRSSADFGGAKARLSHEVREAIASKRFALILLDNRDFWFLDTLERHYRRDESRWFDDPHAFWPRSGARLRPELGYVPAGP